MRIGHGFDVHKFGGQGPIVIGGVNIEHNQGLLAHSDGDVLIHALCDAILGALCLADIGNHFPDTDGDYENISSRILLRHVVGLMTEKGYQLGNADITIVAQAPKMAPHLIAMRTCLAEDLSADLDQINVKATTTEKLGFAGRKEGIAVHAVVLLEKTVLITAARPLDNSDITPHVEQISANTAAPAIENDSHRLSRIDIKSEARENHDNNSALPAWSYLYGKPAVTGDLRTEMSDFKVFEQLPLTPCGAGEHVFIKVRKTGENTAFVARALAQYFDVKEQLISYAGLKDRFAVTEQWFAAHLPGKQTYDLKDFVLEGVEILQVSRHNKKLRIGALTGNRFELVLRNVSDTAELSRRWHAIAAHGVPNYFGEQRFGINGGNISKATSLFSGIKVKDKKKRGLYLSAARSLIFNHIVSERICHHHFDTVLAGDVMMLAGSQSVFLHDKNNGQEHNKLTKRLQDHDLDITAPMWGSGELMTQADAQIFERKSVETFGGFCDGLARFGLKQERRKIRLTPTNAEITCLEGRSDDSSKNSDTVVLSFELPAGCYATTILRELLNYQDLTQRAQR